MRGRSTLHSRAAIAGVLWLIAAWLLPVVHLASHDLDHSHADGGLVFAAREHGHAHPKRERPVAQDHASVDDPSTAHHPDGAAHFAVAIEQVEQIFAPVAERSTWIVEIAAIDRVDHRLVQRPSSRGPPAP